MRPDQFQARMKSICANPNDVDVLRDGARLIVSTFAEECPGYAEGVKLFQERLHAEPKSAVMTGAA